jgi:hypothetical protein
MRADSLQTVRVDLSRRGGWEVRLPGGNRPLTCETLDEARRVAYKSAVHQHPCQLIVYDAYHRVLQREVIAEAMEHSPV